MPHLIRPDFIGVQAEYPDAARTFSTEVVGLKVAAKSPPAAVVLHTAQVPTTATSAQRRMRSAPQTNPKIRNKRGSLASHRKICRFVYFTEVSSNLKFNKFIIS